MNADADSRRLRDVLQEIHLLTVKADAIDLVALAPDRVEHAVFPDLSRYAVDQHVLAALRRVHEFETYAWVRRRESREVMRDRTAVAIVPIFDPGQRLAGGEVLHLRAAAELGRRQPEVIAQLHEMGRGPINLLGRPSGGVRRSQKARKEASRIDRAPAENRADDSTGGNLQYLASIHRAMLIEQPSNVWGRNAF